MNRETLVSRLSVFGAIAGTVLAVACGSAPIGNDEQDPGVDPESVSGSCSLSITKNTYNDYWGTITVKNNGPGTATGFVVKLDVPSGSKCTPDAVPGGSKLSVSGNHCTFTFASTKISSGGTKTFNYSSDTDSFSSAKNVSATSASCGSGGGQGGSGAGGHGGAGAGGGGQGGSGAGGGATGCNDPNIKWQKGVHTQYTSYPAKGSEECIKYSGCDYEGQFENCANTMPESWVKAHNIVSVFPTKLGVKLHNICIKASNGKTVMASVLDTCADTDCSGCCTENLHSVSGATALIDVEKYTDGRLGNPNDGAIQWADMGPTPKSEIAGCN